MMEARLDIPKGRRAISETFAKAEALGLSFIALTGNPRSGVTNKAILKAIKEAKQLFGGLIIAGKMHSAGVDEPLVSLSAISDFIDAGADIILMPAVNTVPGLSEREVREACDLIHRKGALAMTTIGTSQEGADSQTIREIGLINKRSVPISSILEMLAGRVLLYQKIS